MSREHPYAEQALPLSLLEVFPSPSIITRKYSRYYLLASQRVVYGMSSEAAKAYVGQNVDI